MSYILTEASRNNSDQWAAASRVFDTERQAVMTFHQTMASAMANPAVEYCICHVMDENGIPIEQDIYRNTEAQ